MNPPYYYSVSSKQEDPKEVDDAIKAAIAKGIHVVSAASNDEEDACSNSPNQLKEV